MATQLEQLFHPVLVVTRITLREARRRALIWAGVILGLAFLGLYALGLYFAVYGESSNIREMGPLGDSIMAGVLTGALYIGNFLILMTTVLIAVASISGEAANNTLHAIAAKPLDRWQIVLGKWLGYALLLALYVLMIAGGQLLLTGLLVGFWPYQPYGLIAVLYLESLCMLSLTLLGSSIFNTLANGVVIFMFYGVAFIGGVVEQIGMVLGNQTAVDIGIFSSLLMPAEALWRYATSLIQPPNIRAFTGFGPAGFSASQPSEAMLIYAALYALALLVAAIVVFRRRDL